MSKGRNNRMTAVILALVMVVTIIICLLVVVVIRLTLATSRGKTFYVGTTVNSIDVSGLTASEAAAKFESLAEGHQLEVEFADSFQIVTGEEISLSVNPKNQLKKLVREQNKADPAEVSTAGLELMDETLFIYDEAALKTAVESWEELDQLAGQTAEDAALVYSESMGKFAIEPEMIGGTVDADQLAEAIGQQFNTLAEELNVAQYGLYGREIRCAESEEMQQALADANNKLNLRITYTYSVPGAGINGTEEIGYDLLSQWLYVEDDGISIGVNSDYLQAYVTEMFETYSVLENSTSKFVTTNGSFVDVNVPASDETVDTDALFNDIVSCVDNMTSGSRKAPYDSTSAGISGTTNLGGNYVEVDLDNQYLWVYKDKEVVAEGNICSGDVATGCSTPDGLYTIKSMETDRWLNGADYHDWVSYWMPFNGGIGLHDATWRSEDEFGGEVYLKSGSHGCINMPLELAKSVYENVDVGTYVILYGGVASTVERAQTITGTSKYTKNVGDGSFYLDAKSTGDGALSYASSNTKVATVNSSGKVTIVGSGEATIKVTAEATSTYTRATKYITITVQKKQSNTTNQSSGSSNNNAGTGSGSQAGTAGSTTGSTSKPEQGETTKPSNGNTSSNSTGSSGSNTSGGSSGSGSSGGNTSSGSSGSSSSGGNTSGDSSGSGSSGGNTSGDSSGSGESSSDGDSSGGDSSGGDHPDGSGSGGDHGSSPETDPLRPWSHGE